MKTSLRATSLLLMLALLFSMALTACAPTAGPTPSSESPTQSETPPPAEDTAEPLPAEYFEPLQDGYNQVTFYWSYPGTYEACDMWIWWDNKDGQGYRFHECEYGAKVVVNIPEGIDQIGFIVRRDCSDPGGSSWGSAVKDYEQDRFAVIEGRETVIYLKTGDAAQYKSNDGGKTLAMDKEFELAGMVDINQIQYRINPKTTITSMDQVKVYDGSQELAVANISTLGQESAYGYIELEEDLDISKTYRVVIEGYGETTVVPTGIFDTQYFADNYHYDGTDLGAVISGDTTTFKVWAPTASRVVLNLFETGDGSAAYKTVDMVKGDKGVWTHTEACGHGTYYTYTVTTSVGTQEAVDPYARAAGVNGNRGMVVDLALTDPEDCLPHCRPFLL